MNNKLALFEEKEIRKVYKNNKWYYSIQDVISLLTNSKDPCQYLKKLKTKDKELQNSWDIICTPINMQTKNNQIRKIQSSDTMGILRIIESIQESKAEPIKRWLAKIGSERLEEINNPELAMDRMKELYESKGYSKSWIEQREREITTRHILFEEWKSRGINKNIDYIILQNEISKSILAKNIDEYQDIKENGTIKDTMTNLELALINLEELTILEIHNKNNSNGITEIQKDINIVSNIFKDIKKEIELILDSNIVNS